jgi:ABC-type Fe3+ transport system substrate-binding protein
MNNKKSTIFTRFNSFLVIAIMLICTFSLADKLVILSPHSEGHRREMEKGFQSYYQQKFHRTVEIEWLDQGGGSDILRFIQSEFKNKPAGINVDLMYGGGVDPYLELSKSSYLQPYKVNSQILKQIPASLHGIPVYDPQYRWYGTALAGFGILRNDVVIRKLRLPVADSWAELSDPRLMGWVGSADPRHSGSVHMMYEIILQAYGWDKGWDVIEKMGANIKSFTQAASNTPAEVKTGNVAYGLSIDVYAWSQIAEVGKDKMSFVLPNGLTVINPDAIAILKGAPDKAVAEAFVDFVLSDKGQKLLMLPPGAAEGPQKDPLYRMSVSPAVYKQLGTRSNIPVNPFNQKSSMKYDPAKASQRYAIVNDLIGAMIIDSHNELISAAKRASSHLRKTYLCKPPISEAEAMKLADSMKKDPQLRNKLLANWTESARNQYSKIK